MDNTIFNIKARCVYAKPPKEWDEYDLREASDFIASRTIRLADVLLAISKSFDDGNMAAAGWGVAVDGTFFRSIGYHKWNLREDDLEKQSPETIEFLAKILGV